jgi:mono/diheme cytochrome c family protein
MRLFPSLIAAAIIAAAGPSAAQDAAAGAALYADFCAVCHGVEARGDGPMAEVLRIAPPDLTALDEAGAFPILRVASRIDGRDPLVAHGGLMPLYGPWFQDQGPDVAMRAPDGQPVMMSQPIADLIAYLISVQS